MCIKALKAKYSIGKNMNSWTKKNNYSHIQKSVFSCKDTFLKASKWTVGNGRDIDLWNDWWCGSVPLINVIGHTLGRHHTSVSSIISQNGGQNLSEIPSNLHQLAYNIPLTITNPPKDSITWSPSGSGKFSVSSCYKFILSEKGVINDADLNWY